MKKKDLKTILRPLIKKCIKEVLLEEGVLSNIVLEVVSGIHGAEKLIESKVDRPQKTVQSPGAFDKRKQKLSEQRKRMLDVIGQGSYNGVDLFENTEPMRPQGSPSHSPLSSLDPRDPGVDLASIPGSSNWSKLIK